MKGLPTVPWKKVGVGLAGLAGVSVLFGEWMRSDEEVSEVVVTSLMNLFGLVTTPFILETTLALLGLVAVMTYNQWRITQEGDGWVYLAEVKGEEVTDEERKGRLSGVVIGRPDDLESEEAARVATVEGFLELGLAKEAADELKRVRDPQGLVQQLLAIRTHLMLDERDTASALWRTWCGEHKAGVHGEEGRHHLGALFNWLGAGTEVQRGLALEWQASLKAGGEAE